MADDDGILSKFHKFLYGFARLLSFTLQLFVAYVMNVIGKANAFCRLYIGHELFLYVAAPIETDSCNLDDIICRRIGARAFYVKDDNPPGLQGFLQKAVRITIAQALTVGKIGQCQTQLPVFLTFYRL